MDNLYSIWRKQKEHLDKVKIENPDLFRRQPIVDTNQLLGKIGINIFPENRPFVYLRLWPQDFIVEEITKDNRIHTIDYFSETTKSDDEGQTIYADLVKVGVSTLDVIEELEKNLGLGPKSIGYAGIKDRDAITSQLLSFRNVSIDKIQGIRASNFFLKNIYQGKGALQAGDLLGNRFTIILRGTEFFNADAIEKNIKEYEKTGFWNFFYTQRFGTPRLLSHYLGLLLLRRKYEEVIKVLLTRETEYEISYFKKLRSQVLEKWGDWDTAISIFENLPYSFRRELSIFKYLKENQGDFLGALKLFPDQVQIWIYAYASYLFNRKLSIMIEKGDVPDSLPLLLSRNPGDWDIYREFLESDEVMMPSPVFRDFPYIQLKERLVNTRQKFDFQDFKIVSDLPKIGVISFSLPKGSYATTFLAHFFALSGNIPVLPEISTEIVDSQKILDIGSIESITEIFKDVIVSKLESKEEPLLEQISE